MDITQCDEKHSFSCLHYAALYAQNAEENVRELLEMGFDPFGERAFYFKILSFSLADPYFFLLSLIPSSIIFSFLFFPSLS